MICLGNGIGHYFFFSNLSFVFHARFLSKAKRSEGVWSEVRHITGMGSSERFLLKHFFFSSMVYE